jgi:hypothetical protein
MSEGFHREYRDRGEPPAALDVPPGPPPTAAALGREWGLASVLMGSLLFLGSPIMLIFNFLIYQAGPATLSRSDLLLARVASIVVGVSVTGLGAAAVAFGVRAWQAAVAHRQPQGLPLAGLLVSGVGLLLWLMAGCDTLAILFTYY